MTKNLKWRFNSPAPPKTSTAIDRRIYSRMRKRVDPHRFPAHNEKDGWRRGYPKPLAKQS